MVVPGPDLSVIDRERLRCRVPNKKRFRAKLDAERQDSPELLFDTAGLFYEFLRFISRM